jgi:glycine/D-amino acid oxidase-like deaminating enzyme
MSALDRIEPNLTDVIWTKTSSEARASYPPLSEDKDVDLIVVGAGFAGLSIALHAARSGLSVCLLEAGAVGNGASGRNGGYAVPHFPGALRPSQVEQRLGKKKGQALVSLVSDGPDLMFDQIQRYQIRCDPEQNGWAQPAHSEKALASTRAIFEEWKALGAPVEWLDRKAMTDTLGAAGYLGGWWRKSGGTVNPFALCMGLARTAVAQGAVIHEHSPVSKVFREGGRAVALVGEHRVRGRKAIIATNGYTDALTPGLSRSGISVRLFHCVTEPLSAELQKEIVPTRICFTDLRKSGGFSRYDRDGRIISGGAVFSLANPKAYGLAHARRRVVELFPQLKGREPRFEAYWEGYCSITESALPNLQVLDQNIFSLLGFSTRGVALTQNIGRVVGEFLAEKSTLDDVPLEVVSGVRSISMHGVKTLVGRNIFPVYRTMDRYGLT